MTPIKKYPTAWRQILWYLDQYREVTKVKYREKNETVLFGYSNVARHL
jgi:hypothetical protein